MCWTAPPGDASLRRVYESYTTKAVWCGPCLYAEHRFNQLPQAATLLTFTLV